jgi:hypothetical protein
MIRSDPASIRGVATLALGVAMLCAPAWIRDWSLRRHKDEIAARLRRGSDAYFEELRSLKAYPPMRSVVAIRLAGAAITGLGSFLLYDRLTH